MSKESVFIVDKDTNINFDSHQEDGAAWNPTQPNMVVEGGFNTTFLPGDTNNYVWNFIQWAWEYFNGDSDPNAEFLVQLLGITPDLNESSPLYEYKVTPTYPFDVDETRTIQLSDSVSDPNLSVIDVNAGASTVKINLPIRWQHYLGATLNRVWLEGYTKRVHIPLTGSTLGVMELQPVLINLTYDSDMKSDFSDIRFTDSDGCTELDYELVSKTDSTSAVFWVQTIEIAPDPTVEYIYAYYGNSTATTTSDPTLVWDYYDDFGDGLFTGRTDPYDSLYQNSGTGSVTSTSPIYGTYSLKHVGGGVLDYLGVKYTTKTVDNQFSMIFSVKLLTVGTNATSPSITLMYFQYNSSSNWLRLISWWDGSNQKIGLEKNTAGTKVVYASANLISGVKWAVNSVYTFRVDRNNSSWAVYKIVGGVHTTLFTTTGNPGFTSIWGMGCNYDSQALWDNIRYHSPPNDVYGKLTVGTTGSEESTQTINANTVSDEEQQYITFTLPSDWTVADPAYLLLTELDNNIIQTHETGIKKTYTVNMSPHCPTGYYALRLKFIINGTDEMAVNINGVGASYEYLEDLK